MRLPILIVHIFCGTLGVLSGFVAIFLRKGSPRHALAGKIFTFSMLAMSSAGVYLAFLKSQPGNILGGALTFYLVATAWIAAKRHDNRSSLLDWGALLVALPVATFAITFGLEAIMSPTGLKYHDPPAPYLFLGTVALLATIGDLRMLLRGGISGTPRVSRHLWRMSFALFIASASLFLSRQRLFPVIFQKTGVLFLLSFLPLGLMIFWLIRLRFAKRAAGIYLQRRDAKRRAPQSAGHGSMSEPALAAPMQLQHSK